MRGWTTALRSAIRHLDERFPQLSDWLGGRLDVQVPAFGVSVLTHLVFLLTIAMIGIAASSESMRVFTSEVVVRDVPDLTRIDTVELSTPETPLESTAGSFGPNVAVVTTVVPMPAASPTTSAPSSASSPIALGHFDIARPSDLVPQARMLDQTVSIRGNGSEHTGGVEGAVDRIAMEILQRLESGRTLVVWAFDASGSLQAERERLAKHIEGVYAHLSQLDDKQLAVGDALLTAVVAFGKDRKAMTPEPTADVSVIRNAINEVPLDSTGFESTFATVGEIVRRWGKFRRNNDRYQTMIIVVTDEVGDDQARLEDAIGIAHAARVPVYVLGSAALFGMEFGYMDYTDPRTKKFYPHLQVRQGPESVEIERIRLPYWYDGPQFEVLDSGFGPYALSRLAGSTGGIYFVTRLGPSRIVFDPMRLREYKPDWVGRAQYVQLANKDPIRQAVLRAAQVCQQNLPGQPSLTFPAAGGPEFKDAMARNQETVARIAYTVDAALEPIAVAARYRNRETSRRWQAHFDLIRGRLLAMKVRCYEYNWICARMKKDPLKFARPESNAWRLVPDEQIHYSDKAAAAGAEAMKLLKQVVEEHPGTPWALLAQRERKDPLGFKWVETRVPPPAPPRDGGNPRKPKPMPAPSKPEAVPKL